MIQMKAVKMSILAGALMLALSAPVFAQTPPVGAPKPQTPAQPPATAPAQPAAPKPQPPVPFPQDSKFGFVDVQAVASNSVSGKAASGKLEDLGKRKQAQIAEKSKQLDALRTKQASSGVLNDAAKAQLDKDIDKLQREIQFDQQNAQAEYNDLQNELMGDFQKKLVPIIEDIAKEKGLYMIFTGESGFAYVHPGLNLSDEVIKRLDAKKD